MIFPKIVSDTALKKASNHSSERPQHVQESLVGSMASGYPAVVQRASQIVSSMRATVEPGVHMEPVEYIQMFSPKVLSSDEEDSELDSCVCQAGQSIQESRSKPVVHASYDDSLHCHIPALKPLPDFCVVDPSLRVEPSLTQPIQMQLSKKLKRLSEFLSNLVDRGTP